MNVQLSTLNFQRSTTNGDRQLAGAVALVMNKRRTPNIEHRTLNIE